YSESVAGQGPDFRKNACRRRSRDTSWCGLFHSCKIFCEVASVERRLMLLEERHHFRGDIALVEAIASGGDSRLAPLLLGFLFGLDHKLQSSRESGELDRFAGLVHRAVGFQPVALVVGPLLE